MRRSFPCPSQQKSESEYEYASERTTARVAEALSTGERSEAVPPGRRSRAQERQAEHAKEERAAQEAAVEVGEAHLYRAGVVVEEQQ